MGKRKNKSGKQKQKQTKKKSNSSILGKHGSKRSINTDGTTAASANDIRLLCSLPKPKASNPLTSLLLSSSNKNSSNNQKPHNEQEDFHRQLNSMVERSRASDAATTAAASSRRRSLGQKQQRRRKHSNVPANTAAFLSSTMKPASFSLVKSTNQLMEETMHQMGQIMSTSTGGHGHTHMLNPAIASGSSSLARAAASIASSERTPIASNVHKTAVSMRASSGSTANIRGIAGIGNSFSALGGTTSDSEDDELARANSQSQEQSQQPRIQFAPAAFSLGSSRSTPLSSASSTSASRLLLPTKTPPTTPSSTPNHYRRVLETSKRASLFGTINEEEIEELHYQQQTVGLQHGAEGQRKGPTTTTTATTNTTDSGMGEHDDDL
jgi:hypothetical protein